MMEHYEPEAFSAEFEEFEQACAEQALKDAKIHQIWKDFGFDDETAFQMMATTPRQENHTIEELLKMFA